MPELTRDETIYLAGLFDGEGYVGIEREVRKDRGGKLRHRTIIAISNTDRDVVELFRRKVRHGFIATLDRGESRKENWKPLHVWKCKGGSAKFVLGQILPWLIVKKPQAELALSGPDTEEKWLAIKALNRRGRETGSEEVTEVADK